jgi:hypothetical protein
MYLHTTPMLYVEVNKAVVKLVPDKETSVLQLYYPDRFQQM